MNTEMKRPFSLVFNLLSVFCIVWFLVLPTRAQTIDSLMNALNNGNLADTSRISILNQLSFEYKRVDVNKSFYYANLADSASSSIGFSLGRAEALLNIGYYHLRTSQYDVAIVRYSEAQALFKSIDNKVGIANTLLGLGAVHNQKTEYNEALEFYQKSLEIWKSLPPKKYAERIAAVYNNMGVVYRIQGNYVKAIEHYQNSLILKKEIGDSAGMSDTYNNLGVVYRIQHNYDQALENYFKALRIRKNIDYKRGVAMTLNNIGIVYKEMQQYDEALKYFDESLLLRKELNDKRGIAHVYNNMGDVHLRMNNLAISFEFFKNGLDAAREIGYLSTQSYCLMGLGKVLLRQGAYQKAYDYGREALNLAREVGDITTIEEVSRILAETSAALGKFQKAYEYQVLHKVMSDSILNETNTKKIVGLEFEYKYHNEKVEQEKQTIEQRAKLTRQKQVTIIFIFGFALTLILVIIVLLSFRRKQRDFEIISNQKKLLQDQAMRLRELDEIKSRFFTNISHEFRTPLTLILGPVEEMLEQARDSKTKELLFLIQTNAKNLMGLINQLLDISKVEKGMVRMNFTYSNICMHVANITEMFRNQAENKKIELNFATNVKDIEGYVDKEKLERMLFNLISNAIKNTESGSISIAVAKVDDGKLVEISVSDTGKGIADDKIPYVFDRFYMADDSVVSGSGIGLAYTNELVKLYKGSISVSSAIGVGSKFVLRLPLTLESFSEADYDLEDLNEISLNADIVEDSVVSQAIQTEKNQGQKENTVLLVEDHEELRRFVVSNLSSSYNVIEAENGKVGIELALMHAPDLIITDVMMPEIDGIQLSKTLKTKEETSHIPIIMLTAKASEQSKLEGLETQVDDYLTKPFSMRELAVRIRNILANRQILREKYKQALVVNPSEITTNSVDERFIGKVLEIVEQQMANPEFSVDMLCEAAGVSRSSLHNKLKSLVNQSATEFINTIRVKRAAQLIKQNVGTISEIAYDVGFNNLSYFSKVFKKHMGINPSELQA